MPVVEAREGEVLMLATTGACLSVLPGSAGVSGVDVPGDAKELAVFSVVCVSSVAVAICCALAGSFTPAVKSSIDVSTGASTVDVVVGEAMLAGAVAGESTLAVIVGASVSSCDFTKPLS